MNVLRDLTNSIAFRIKLLAFSGFQKNSRFVLKNQFFSRGNQFFNTLRSFTISVASFNKFFYLCRFLQNQFIFEKPIYFIYYNQILKLSRSLTFSVAFYRKFATFSIFFKELNFFFSKNHHIVPSRNLNFERLENFYILNAIVDQICCSSDFKTFKIFIENPSFFFYKKSKFWTFRGNLLTRLLFTAKTAAFSGFQKTQDFSLEKPILFSKIQFWTFWRFSKFQSHFSAILIPVAIFFENKRFFLRKSQTFF